MIFTIAQGSVRGPDWHSRVVLYSSLNGIEPSTACTVKSGCGFVQDAVSSPTISSSLIHVRLTQIKLAGFKSFVDPTHLNVPGDLVGVVGPNGCGKSNIIDAVRWVLGESRASALRGDSMQDVIFNGSTLRKPVSRASVELVFDNSLGRAAGQWSEYAEISVKRVLTREGDSSYLINNTIVRRRDIHDIFLGTGLGPRAYAIIEQGMISRIIEAKPEELRVFLEEAAGVSKYKDRRRETENRLADTRENLARVGDIRDELAGQIEKLERQAEVARQFNELSARRQERQHVLWVLKRRDSEEEAQRHLRDLDKSVNELEATTARLREVERQLEESRVEHYAAGDLVSTAQGELFAANSEVARLEGEIRHLTELRQRLESEISKQSAQLEISQRRSEELSEAVHLWEKRAEEMGRLLVEKRGAADDALALMPNFDEANHTSRQKLDSARDGLAAAEQAHRLELANKAHSERLLHGLSGRHERLSDDLLQLGSVDESAMSELGAEVAALQDGLAENVNLLAQSEERCKELEAAAASSRGRVQELELACSALDAKSRVLRDVQSKIAGKPALQDWLSSLGISPGSRIWQGIRARDGWEVAVEIALGARLQAFRLEDVDFQRIHTGAPGATALAFRRGPAFSGPRLAGLRPLLDAIEFKDPEIEPVVSHWLHGFYMVDTEPSSATLDLLPDGVRLIDRIGRMYTRLSIETHVGDSESAGMLAREREIGELESQLSELRNSVVGARAELAAMEGSSVEGQRIRAALREQSIELTRKLHELQVQLLKMSQEHERISGRSAQILAERTSLDLEIASERESAELIAERIEGIESQLIECRNGVESARSAYRDAEQALETHKRLVSSMERESQEAAFAEKEAVSKVEDLKRNVMEIGEQIGAIREQAEIATAELSGLDDSMLKEQLQLSLSVRVECESRLADVRRNQDQIGEQLRALEESRQQAELQLEPLRTRIADLRLKEQAARMGVQQFAEFLAEAGLDDAKIQLISEGMPEKSRASAIQSEINKLTSDISSLGAINMAALDELSTSTERKEFLDAQATDLASALETLESAIKRIDRETRDLMQQTFDAVNEQFGKLFPMLFGGGEARLVMTGEEILDAGVQVVARPPGKKNSTIHLLSGGEKAMTAISLVFSFFQLNPAPFCLLDEVDAPLDDANTGRFCELVKKMSQSTQFLYISHNKLTMEMATHLVGVTMQEQGVSRVVAVDIDQALELREPAVA